MEIDATFIARNWLLTHGYSQFKDGTWSYRGEEADAETVLIEYIEEQKRLSK